MTKVSSFSQVEEVNIMSGPVERRSLSAFVIITHPVGCI